MDRLFYVFRFVDTARAGFGENCAVEGRAAVLFSLMKKAKPKLKTLIMALSRKLFSTLLWDLS